MHLLTRKIDQEKAQLAIKHLRDHIEYLADLANVSERKRSRYLLGEFDDSVFRLNCFIADLEKCEVSFPASEQIAMYLEFRKRNLLLTGLHTQEIVSSTKELTVLVDYFNSNSGI